MTPRLCTPDPARLVAVLIEAFDAAGDLRVDGPTELRLGDSLIMVSGGGGLREATSSILHIYVENADETFRRAVGAGAISLEPPGDMPHSDCRAAVRDPAGNIWQIATWRGEP